MPEPLTPPLFTVPGPVYTGGNRVRLMRGGEELFPAMTRAIAAATSEVWVASYIFHDDPTMQAMARTLCDAADRGVSVNVVVDGFGSKYSLATMRGWLDHPGLKFTVFRPLDRWWSWMQPGQLRRLHQKLCVVDGEVAFVGGINLIDDRLDLHHGWVDTPRLDFAVQVEGPLVDPIRQTARAMWTRAALGREWSQEALALARSAAPVARAARLVRRLRIMRRSAAPEPQEQPMRAAFLVRDNLLQRRAIERAYVLALREARERVDIACPYFYPGRVFRRVLRQAARRGVRVRLLLQGKIDYRIAAMAARAMYDELLAHGIEVYEYTPAFLHAKVALVDRDWATVGSSNIDPISLLLNLEANVVVRDEGFNAELGAAFEAALACSRQVVASDGSGGGLAWLSRGFVAWCAATYLRVAGNSGRY